MSRSPSSRALVVSALPGGHLEGVWRGPVERGWTGKLALVLDGTVQAVVPLEPGLKGSMRFAWQLPNHLLFNELDVLALPDGESLLGLPMRLAPLFNVVMDPPAADGPMISGSFTGADWLCRDIGVELLHAGGIAARGIATRDGGAGTPWRFSLHLAALPRPGQSISLLPRIGGLMLPGPALDLAPDATGFQGCLDAVSPEHVTGWARNLAHPGLRVKLEVVVDARVVGRVTAGTLRHDLLDAGMGDGKFGFDLRLPDHPDPTARRRIGVRLAGTTTELSGSPVVLDPVPGLSGCFDSLHGMCAHGWALDRAHPEIPVSVEVVGPGGEILATASATQFRGDLLDAGLNGGRCAFKIDLSAHFDRLMEQELVVRIAGTDSVLPGSPRRVSVSRNLQRFLRRRQVLRPGVLPRLKRALNYRAGDGAISFIMPVFNTPRAWLVEALESVRTQFCDKWELICVNDGSTEPHVADVLASYARRDGRFRILTSPQNVGIARAVNFGLRAARHPYVAFIDHDDYLEPDAAWQLIRAAQRTDADLLYSDEAITDENINAITEFRLRPAFSHDFYLSHPYFVHLVCARTDIARRIGGWDESMPISADVDFILRVMEQAKIVTHVPAVLYRWRTHGGSTGHTKQDAVMKATTGALQRHLDRLGKHARVSEGVWFNQFRVDWPGSEGLVLIVIPTKNKVDLLRTAISSIENTAGSLRYRLVVIDHESDDPATRAYLDRIAARHVVMPYAGPFNFSAMNNAAVRLHGSDAEFVLFLNNDVEALQDGWIDRLRALAHRPQVGIVGALLMYADQRVQHAGVVLGFNDSADHALKFQDVFLDKAGRRNLGYNCGLTSVRDYTAVTAACMMMRRAVFDEVGGFDEDFAIGFNDTDLCLRVGERGYKILYDGATVLFHYESATRSLTSQVFHPEDTQRMITRWGDRLRGGDRFYNPNLSLRTQDHVPREDDACRVIHTPRATTVAF